MGGWLSGLVRLGGDLAGKQARRIGEAIALWGLAAVFILIAIGFATAGIYAAIRTALDPVPSLFIMAAIFIGLALIVVVVAGQRRKHHRPVEPLSDVPELKMSPEGARLASLGTVAAAFAFGLVRGLMRRRR